MRHLMATVIGAGLILSACNPDILNTKPEVRGLKGAAPVQTLTNPADGTETTLRPGGQMVVRLTSNPTTGYYWYLVEAGEDAVIHLASESYTADPAPEGLVGGGGVQVFVFDGVGVGRTTLALSYQRDQDDVADRLELKVRTIE